MTSNSPSEKRLEELREQAWKDGVVPGKGVDVAGGPIPRKPGYYGQAVVKPPVWTWQVPLYFFMGGIAGMSAVIALAAVVFHHVGRGHRWRDPLTDFADHGSWSPTPLPQHAARF